MEVCRQGHKGVGKVDLLQLNKTSNVSYKIELRFDWSEARFHTGPKHSLHEYIRPVGLAGRETKPTTLKEQHAHRIFAANEAKSAILYIVVLVEIESRVPARGPPPEVESDEATAAEHTVFLNAYIAVNYYLKVTKK